MTLKIERLFLLYMFLDDKSLFIVSWIEDNAC